MYPLARKQENVPKSLLVRYDHIVSLVLKESNNKREAYKKLGVELDLIFSKAINDEEMAKMLRGKLGIKR